MVEERLLVVRPLQLGLRRRSLGAEHRVQVRSLEEGLDGGLQALVTRHYGRNFDGSKRQINLSNFG